MSLKQIIADKKDKIALDKIRHRLLSGAEPKTVRQILNSIKIYGNRTCIAENIVKGAVEHSAAELYDDVCALGTFLLKNGLSEKNIAVIGDNSYNWIVSFFAIVCIGSVAVPFDRELDDVTMCVLAEKSNISALFFSKDYFGTVKGITDKCPGVIVYSLDGNFSEYRSVAQLTENGRLSIKSGDKSFFEKVICPEDTAAVIFTSGTTGANKGAMLTHGNLTQNINNLVRFIPSVYKSLSVLPVNHIYELSCGILTALYMNAVVYINGSLRHFMRNIVRVKPDFIATVPLLVEAVYNSVVDGLTKAGKYDYVKRMVKTSNFLLDVFGIDLRNFIFRDIRKNFGKKFPTLICGGAPATPEHIEFLCGLGFEIYNGYGMTEASPVISINLDCRKNPCSVGKVFNSIELKINSPDNNGIGEIFLKGKNIFKGYYNDIEATQNSFENGWFKTGDCGYVDLNGLLYITGRKKNLILLSNGKNVSPEEIENFFTGNIDLISQAVVFEAKKLINGRYNKIIAAVFSIKSSKNNDILRFIENKINDINKELPPYKRISDYRITSEAFDINSAKKIIRSRVIEKYYKNTNNFTEEK